MNYMNQLIMKMNEQMWILQKKEHACKEWTMMDLDKWFWGLIYIKLNQMILDNYILQKEAVKLNLIIENVYNSCLL